MFVNGTDGWNTSAAASGGTATAYGTTATRRLKDAAGMDESGTHDKSQDDPLLHAGRLMTSMALNPAT